MSFTFRPEVLTTTEGATFCALFVGSVLKYLGLRQARAARDRLSTYVGQVTELVVYPIKGCAGVHLQSATADVTGLFGDDYYDRRWMIESEEGEFVNMKQEPRLSLVTSTVDGDWLVVSAPDMTPLRLPRNPDPAKFEQRFAKVFGTKATALDCGSEANAWMSRFIGKPVRLVHSRPGIGLVRDAHDRVLNWETQSRRGDKVVFQYMTAYLLTTTASLSELNSRLDTPVTSRNFRPNIVVSSVSPFDEDNWEEIRIGTNAKFRYVQPCRRCIITTVDPQTGQRNTGSQPLAKLQTYRQRAPYGTAPLFGAYIALDCVGPIKVGDPVYVIRRQ